MKKLLILFLSILSCASFGQSGSQAVSGIKYRVNDSTAYQSAVATAHSQGYADIYWNNQATTPHWDIWNGSSYDHVFDFNSGGSGSGEFTYDIEVISGTTHTVNAAAIGSLNKWFIYTNASGCTVTLDEDVTEGKSVVGQRGPSAGTVTFQGDGTSTVTTSSGDYDLEAVNRLASWTKQTATLWHGVGELGPSSGGLQNLQDVLDLGSTATISGDYEVLSQGGNAVATHSMINQGGTQARHIIQSETTVSGTAGIDAYVNDGSNHYAQVFAVNTSSAGGRVDVAQDGVTVITGSQVERIKIDADGSWDMAGTTPGTSGQVLTSNGSGSAPSWQDAAGGVSDGDKGDITVSSSGTVWNIDGGVVTGTEIATSVALAGNPTTTTQTPGTNNTTIATTAYVDAAVTAGSIPDGDKGDITVSGSGATWTIDNLVVTPAKMSTFSSSDMRGKYTDETGTGSAYFQGGDIGTPSAGVGTNITGIPYANLTGTAPFWSLASGGTLTGANTITGSTSNTFKMVFPGLGSTFTEGAGLFMENTTAAALGAQQEGPSWVVGGYAWNSGVSQSHSVKVRGRLTPVQSSSTVSGNYAIGFSINGGAFSDGVTFSSNAGTNRITTTGLSTGSTSFSLRAEDSGNVPLFRVRDDGALLIGNAGSPAIIAPINNSTTTSKTGPALHFSGSSGTAAHHIFNNTSASPGNIVTYRANIANSSGTSSSIILRSDVTINNTGGTGHIVSFIDYAPNETSLTGTSHYFIRNSSTTARTGLGTSSPSEMLHVVGNALVTGNITASTAGSGILIKEGSNATMGAATLSAGTVTVNTTKVTANSRIFLTIQSLGTVATPKSIGITARSASTSFTITSEDVTDTSVIAWMIIEPAP